MKKRLACSSLFSLAVLTSPATAATDPCRQLIESFQLNYTGDQTITGSAGEGIQVNLTSHIKNAEVIEEWDFVPVVLTTNNNIVGSVSVMDINILSPEDNVLAFALPIGPSMGGVYRIHAEIQAQRRSSDGPQVCFADLNIPNFETLTLEVQNSPENTDIRPPIISDIRIAPSTLSLAKDSSFEIDFLVNDASEICTKSLEEQEPPLCRAPHHVQFSDTADPSITYDAGPFVEHREGNRYFIRLKPSDFYSKVKAGQYKLTFLNVHDIHANGDPRITTNHLINILN